MTALVSKITYKSILPILFVICFTSCEKWEGDVCGYMISTMYLENKCDEVVVVHYRDSLAIRLDPKECRRVHREEYFSIMPLRRMFGDTVTIHYGSTCDVTFTFINNGGYYQFIPTLRNIFDESNWKKEEIGEWKFDYTFTILPPGETGMED